MSTGNVQEKKHFFDVRVYYEDTDAGGIVYYANYLKFAERGRTEFLRHLGFNQQVLAREKNFCFVVSKASVAYLTPLRLDDVIEVQTTIESCSKISITFKQDLCVNGQCAAMLDVAVVSIDRKTGRPKALPQDIKEKMMEFMND